MHGMSSGAIFQVTEHLIDHHRIELPLLERQGGQLAFVQRQPAGPFITAEITPGFRQ